MYELKKNRKVLTNKSVRTGSSSYEKRIYRAAVSQRLRNTEMAVHLYTWSVLKCLRMSRACSTDTLRFTLKLNSYIVIPCITIRQLT